MNENVKQTVTQILTSYLETNKLRRTPERYAILDAIYSINGQFKIETLDQLLLQRNFRVSRATLYNTIRLFLTLRLVVRHRMAEGTFYEGCYDSTSHCYQICTFCGRTTAVQSAEITEALEKIHLRRFHKDVYSMYIYGVCSTCLAKQTRLRRLREKNGQ